MLGKHTLKSQEKTELTVSYITKGRPGPFQKKIWIFTEIEGSERVELTVTGTVAESAGAKIEASPRKIEFGQLGIDTPRNQVISMTNTGTQPLVIRKVSSRAGNRIYYDGAEKGEIVVAPGESKPLEIEIRFAGKGPFREIIVIESNAVNTTQGGYFVMVTGMVE